MDENKWLDLLSNGPAAAFFGALTLFVLRYGPGLVKSLIDTHTSIRKGNRQSSKTQKLILSELRDKHRRHGKAISHTTIAIEAVAEGHPKAHVVRTHVQAARDELDPPMGV